MGYCLKFDKLAVQFDTKTLKPFTGSKFKINFHSNTTNPQLRWNRRIRIQQGDDDERDKRLEADEQQKRPHPQSQAGHNNLVGDVQHRHHDRGYQRRYCPVDGSGPLPIPQLRPDALHLPRVQRHQLCRAAAGEK